MARFDEDEEERLRRLAEEDGDADTLGEAMARSRAREELETRDRMAAPTEHDEEVREEAADVMEGLDLSALDGLDERARGAGTDTPPAMDRNPDTDDMDMREWQNLPNDPEPERVFERPDMEFTLDEVDAENASREAPPDDPEAAAAFDAWNEAEMAGHAEPDADEAGGPPDGDADDMGTIGAAMDHDPSATTASLDLDEPYAPDAPEADELLMPLDNPATAATFASVNESLRRHAAEADDGATERTADPSLDDLAPMPEMAADSLPEMLGTEEGVSGLDEPGFGMEDPPAELGAAKSTPEDRPLERPDFTGADWSDAIRRPLHALGAGLLAASGRGSGSAFRSERDELEERLRARDTAKGEATRAFGTREDARMTRDARASEAAATAEERRRHNLAMEELGGRRAATGEARAETYGSEAVSRNAARDAEAAHTEASFDPDSLESERARERLPALAMGLPPDLRGPVTEYLAGRRWTADEVETFEMRSPAWWRSRLGRGSGAAGGGAGGAARRSAAVEALVAAGYDRGVVEAMDSRRLQDALDEVTGGAGGGRGAAGGPASDFIPGVPMSAITVSIGEVEERAVRTGLNRRSDALAALSEMEEIAPEAGPGTIADFGLESELAVLMGRLRGAMTEIQHSGSMTEGERAMIDQIVPDPTSLGGWTLNRYRRALDGWRRGIEDGALTTLSDLGVDEETAIEGVSRMGRRRTRRGRGAAPEGSSGGVTVIGRDGGPIELTAEEWAEVQREGLEDEFEVVR